MRGSKWNRDQFCAGRGYGVGICAGRGHGRDLRRDICRILHATSLFKPPTNPNASSYPRCHQRPPTSDVTSHLGKMIDLYWTVIPVLLVHFFASHPGGEYNVWRSAVVVVLTWVWAVRLTHNYLRREKWQWGVREDWRFTDMAQEHGKNWWWVSFFGVYLIQQVRTICLV